ncbi:hypothetical protein HUB98_05230 [Paenibacillus barcinonensis]|uniref:Uncharacterized protein n=1 Tax=Paenibacillus barcinonensis TaxID=198119 RepID=A0A2V4WSP9_PAEBA|nr:hypothetical protein [Paenibacillus barcinonensis]PYE51389.1 hypothetical protein DFQ00_102183 [Paenibacillus barcinonensis]QKS55785.1 hypothetical protein HUB98_05230 [Paenibacillus barcinonensis]
MTQIIKAKSDTLTEAIVASMIGKYVHAPTNIHEVQTPTGATTKANVWFAGIVAGYEKAVIGFNYEDGDFSEQPQTYFNVHLTDGMGYILTTAFELELFELSEEEFNKLIDEKKEEESLVADSNEKIALSNDGDEACNTVLDDTPCR